ncbi:hypothetical protein [Sphaerisporangium sp. NPDC051011]|uniref:hypothetical protein n=1 Tax=Sphaerisporangium sp. NPDC051011 TaxID=3155792 RepID=UPI0033F88A46
MPAAKDVAAAFEAARKLGTAVSAPADLRGATNHNGIRRSRESGFMIPHAVHVHLDHLVGIDLDKARLALDSTVTHTA